MMEGLRELKVFVFDRTYWEEQEGKYFYFPDVGKIMTFQWLNCDELYFNGFSGDFDEVYLSVDEYQKRQPKLIDLVQTIDKATYTLGGENKKEEEYALCIPEYEE